MATIEFEAIACTDCVLILANDDDSSVSFPETHRAAMRIYSAGTAWYVTDDEPDNFSTRPCGVCGTHLAGERHTVVALGN